MVGEFRYAATAPRASVAVEMFVAEGKRQGVVRMPEEVATDCAATWGQHVDEPLALPVALGLAVIVAALSGLDLFMVGTRAAWDAEWGTLVRDDGLDTRADLDLALH